MSYTDEYRTALQRIAADNPKVQNLTYFLDTAALWHAQYDEAHTGAQSTPSVVVLGNGVPEQLIYACGAVPHFLLGGSLASCEWSDGVVPRDSDPVSRSILGYALRLARRQDANPLFVVPMTNDNMRKIAYLLEREGSRVHVLDIPSEGLSEPMQRAWEHSAHALVEAVRRHAGRGVSTRSLREAHQLVLAARAAALDFEQASAQRDDVLTSEASLLVLNTYYQTSNLAQWTTMLRRLTTEIASRPRIVDLRGDYVPRVLVLGSPIVFPQYKVPSLIQQSGLSLLAAVDARSTSRFANLVTGELKGGTSRLIDTIARKHYTFDSSGAHVVNRSMEHYVEHLISVMEVDGIVFHILKGQIEHDFELTRVESLVERYDIPVFRLETDYQHQDVEQLRIRLEAFAEMLEQRAFTASQQCMSLRYA